MIQKILPHKITVVTVFIHSQKKSVPRLLCNHFLSGGTTHTSPAHTLHHHHTPRRPPQHHTPPHATRQRPPHHHITSFFFLSPALPSPPLVISSLLFALPLSPSLPLPFCFSLRLHVKHTIFHTCVSQCLYPSLSQSSCEHRIERHTIFAMANIAFHRQEIGGRSRLAFGYREASVFKRWCSSDTDLSVVVKRM